VIKNNKIKNLLNKQVVVLDGATGTELQKKGLPAGACPEIWCLENPTVISEVHASYQKAGARVVYTCTFGANRFKLQQYGVKKDVYAINRELARLAKKACGNNALVAGDIGPTGVPMMHDPTPPPPADVVLLESTYGDRDHRSQSETTNEFHDIISNAIWDREKVLIPAFAVGRTQQLIYQLARLAKTGSLPRFPVYIDSPMAITATELYRRHRNLFDADAQAIIDEGDGLLDLPGLKFLRTPAESKQLNEEWGAGVVIAASGMCTGGRILHHLKHNLWRKGAHVVIVGYQANGSLGRRLVEGQKHVRVLGEWIAVRAHIHTLGGFSAHAGRSDLLKWLEPVAAHKPRIMLNHGEDAPRHSLAAEITRRHAIDAELPGYLSVTRL